ncbi:hypothetical protein THAOC_29601 [Thalassiosira oceanica]|uniref:Uncharacterized protein n=1 Tax=Thalassiosira oceanica TaxID=159749 RepID=K0RG48_THAOC|nr:hypothetical protein THAOC_29601 [Thalassiosira oceanica]|eukprot:EJK51244.1 hypothetical protein THAOC_29601 [Thalassiosira oceanica]
MGGSILASQAPSIAILINRVAGVVVASVIVATVPTKAKRVSRRHHRPRSGVGIAGPPGVVPKHPERRNAAGRQPSIYIELNEAPERWERARTCPSIGTASWGILTPGAAEIGASVEWCATSHSANLATRSYRCVEHLSERPYVQYHTYRLVYLTGPYL